MSGSDSVSDEPGVAVGAEGDGAAGRRSSSTRVGPGQRSVSAAPGRRLQTTPAAASCAGALVGELLEVLDASGAQLGGELGGAGSRELLGVHAHGAGRASRAALEDRRASRRA